jgi:alkylation response protein AidB-like acyl-CoA dehydrogenase
MSAADVLERVKKLEQEIRDRVDEIEQGRRVPRDLVDKLADAGAFGMLVPTEYGGAGASLWEYLAVFEELAAMDGSVGWVVMIGATGPPLLSHFPRPTFEDVYGTGTGFGGGTLAPKGAAEVDGDGYRVTGQWPFASGCEHCDWLVVHSIVTEDGKPRITDRGPDLRLFLLPRADVEILDTWHVAGLRGTGSHDLKVDGVFVPPERVGKLFGGSPSIDSTLYRIPVLPQFSNALASVAVGIARGALTEAITLSTTKRPAFKPMHRVAEDPLARFELGRADTLLAAAMSLLRVNAERAWDHAERNLPWTEVDQMRLRAGGWQATQLAKEVVEIAYAIGGGTALYESSPLQRRLRDVHAVTQHAGVSRDMVSWLGGFLLGEPVPEARL